MSTTKYIDVQKALQNLEDTDLHAANIEAIQTFTDECAAEGLSDVRQRRLITALKSVLIHCAPDGFTLPDADESDLKQTVASLHRTDRYTKSTKHTMKAAVKKFYKIENGGEHPAKVDFFSVHNSQSTTVSREDLFTDDELKELFRSFSNTRDRALTMLLYESAARPGEVLSRNLADFTTNEKGDFIHLEGLKGTPDRTNQLVRAGRTVKEWIHQHPFGGEAGDIEDPSAPLWVKTEQQACKSCGQIPHQHNEQECSYTPDLADRLSYDGFLRRFKDACERAAIPENKRKPYNLRHTRLTEVATFMGYEQLNKFAGWMPGSDRAKVYVHLNNDDVNKSIRDHYGLGSAEDVQKTMACPFCGSENETVYNECRTCGRPLSLEKTVGTKQKQRVIERLAKLEEDGVLDQLSRLQAGVDSS